MAAQLGSFGWIDNPKAVTDVKLMLPVPNVSEIIKDIAPKQRPSHVYLWDACRKVTGDVLRHWNQKQVGSCEGFGNSKAAAVRACVEIALNGDMEKYVDIAQEVTYSIGRMLAGIRGYDDGGVGSYTALGLHKHGYGKRGKYNSFDLTSYNESTCRKLGSTDVPADILAEASNHPFKTISQVTNWDDAKNVLAKGGTIAISSNRGFSSMHRDSNGMVKPSGSWAHCMALIGCYEESGLDMGFIDNSWDEDAFTGPIGPGDGPLTGFWVDGNVIENDILKSGDCWAFYDLEGFKIDYTLDFMY